MVRRLTVLILLVLIFLVGLFFLVDISLPLAPPALDKTMTPHVQRSPLEIGSYDVMGQVVSRQEAEVLLQTAEGREMLSREQGALEITEELLELGREIFYLETFGNEVFLTEVMGTTDGPINLGSVSRAILDLRGGHTTNLQIRVEEDLMVGGQHFPEGTLLDTGLDVPAGWVMPLGMRVRLNQGRTQVGITCALCHAAVDPETGLIIEGATNTNLDVGLILAMASNSTAVFRRTDINPTDLPTGSHSFINEEGEVAFLPDPQTVEEAVEANFLAWPSAAMFDLTDDLVSNPTFTPSSFTFGQWPYGWNGFASIGYFQGLHTISNNVHSVTADGTNDYLLMGQLMEGIDSETYLAVVLQNAANERFRLPDGALPSEFYHQVAPHPETPGVLELVTMPGYPSGSFFVPNAMVANSDGMPIGVEIAALSAFQHSLAPPPNRPTDDIELLRDGADVFVRAGCADCHSGRHFSNNSVIPLSEIGTQPSRALGQADAPEHFVESYIYPPSITAPPPADAPLLAVPSDLTPPEIREHAYLLNDAEGGYKVVTLIGVYLQAPYLHDGGVAAGPGALRQEGDRFVVADPGQLGMAGTLNQGVRPDPAASLRVLVDRQLRAPMVAANQADESLQRTNIEGIGHEFWVDIEAGFTVEEQTNLILFLLSLDDDPLVLPETNR